MSVNQRISWVLIAAAAAWAAWNGAGYASDSRTAYRAEAAWLIFSAALIASRLLQAPAPIDTATTSIRKEPPAGWALLAIAAAVVLYAPVLGVGLLSDDFVLLRRAREGVFIDGSWEFVRPLPLAIWRAIDALLPAAAVPAALHVLNAALHGLNAWLVFVCATRLGLPRRTATLAAALFLASPFQVEAVTWAAGIFDLTMTAFVLSAVAVALNIQLAATRRMATSAALAIGAIACKETGVVAPLLIVLAAALGPAEQRRITARTAAIAMVIAVAYVAWRSVGDFPPPAMPEAGFIKHKLLTRPFGALGFGIHRDVLASAAWIGLIAAVCWPIVLARAAWRWDARVFTMLAFATAWVLVSVAPLLTMFFVSETLEGARYVYLGSAMWTVGIVSLIAGVSPRITAPAAGILMLLIVASASLVFAHQRPWLRAAATRDRVLAAAVTAPAECNLVAATGLPDTEAGAYVFRNGFADAMTPRPMSSGVVPCAWDVETGRFRVESRP